jgi:drug/metabolite transporter (DMT)-like permease
MFQNKWSVIGIAIFCSVLWGSAFPVLKISNQELQLPANEPIAQIVFAGIRFLLAGMMILCLVFITNRKLLFVKRKQFFILILLGFIQTAVQYFFFYNGLEKVSGMQGAILSSSGTFLTVLLAHFYYKNDQMDVKKTIGLIAGFAGIILVNWGQEISFSFQWTGEGFMIMSGLTSAIATIMAKELARDIHPFTLTGWQLSVGALLLLLIGLPQYQDNMITFTPFGLALLLYAALLSAVAFALWYSILKYNKAGEISIYKFLTPVSGAVLSAMFIPGESFNPTIIFALMLVAAGIFVVNYHGTNGRAFFKALMLKHK